MVDPPADRPAGLPVFGAGEAEAIALAERLQAVILVNERCAAKYALNLGIDVVTVPSLIVAHRALEIISDRAARKKLALIAPIAARDHR
ncbi:MAG: hypothetical protein ACRDIY_02140 [Chloroflexota bacterium]